MTANNPSIATAVTHHGTKGWLVLEGDMERIAEAIGGFLWIGNNLHNSGTETFRELYGSAMVDARLVYDGVVARKDDDR